MPKEDDELGTFCQQAAVDADRLKEAGEALKLFGGNLSAATRHLLQCRRDFPPVEWVVRNLVMRGAVTLLVGQKELGKSTLALQIGRNVALGDPVLGRSVTQDGGLVLYCTGEDNVRVAIDRVQAMGGGGGERPFNLSAVGPEPLEAVLADYETSPKIDLVIVDTLSSFLEGSPSDPGAARRVVTMLSRFAAQHNCAVLAVHHEKERQDREPIVGSAEFARAARMVLTFRRAGSDFVLKVTKNNSAPNALAYDKPIFLHRDETTWTYGVIASPGDVAASNAVPNENTDAGAIDADTTAMAAVVNAAIAAGRPVALSGKNEPFKWGATELAGWPRARVRRAHERAIQRGLIAPSGAAGLSAAAE